MSPLREQLQPLIVWASTQDDDVQQLLVDGLEEIGPDALVATYIATRELMEDRELAGFFDSVKKFFGKIGDGVKKVAQTAAPIAAPFLSMIPGIGPALATGAQALAVPIGADGRPDMVQWQLMQQRAAAQINAFGTAMGAGQITPEAIAFRDEANELKVKLAAAKAKVKAQKQINEGTILGLDPKVLLIGGGALLLLMNRRR